MMIPRTPQPESLDEVPRRTGAAAAIWAGLMRRVRPWLFLSRVLVRELQTDRIATEREEGVTIRVATPDDLALAAAAVPERLDAAFVAAALLRGDVCLAAFHDGQLVAYVWRSFTTAPHADGLWVQVAFPYWYTYKTYTRPDFRGQRLSGALTLYGDEVCRDRGCRRGVGFIETHNYPSIRANLRLGSRPVGFAGYVKLFGKTCPFRTRGVVPHTLRFYHPAQSSAEPTTGRRTDDPAE